MLFRSSPPNSPSSPIAFVEGESSEATPEVVEDSTHNTETGNESELEVVNTHSQIDLDYDVNFPPLTKWTKSHPPNQVIGNPQSGVLTRSQLKARSEFCLYHAFLSKVEPKKVKEALEHSDWIEAMQAELAEFERNKVWQLVPKPENASLVGLKWVFRNKLDKEGNVVRNKARLVVKGYSQMEGIDYDETFAPVARLEDRKSTRLNSSHRH